jgi:hypothetical protein
VHMQVDWLVCLFTACMYAHTVPFTASHITHKLFVSHVTYMECHVIYMLLPGDLQSGQLHLACVHVCVQTIDSLLEHVLHQYVYVLHQYVHVLHQYVYMSVGPYVQCSHFFSSTGMISHLGVGFECVSTKRVHPIQQLTNLLVSLVKKSKDNKDGE